MSFCCSFFGQLTYKSPDGKEEEGSECGAVDDKKDLFPCRASNSSVVHVGCLLVVLSPDKCSESKRGSKFKHVRRYCSSRKL